MFFFLLDDFDYFPIKKIAYSEEKAKILDAADTCGKDSSNLSEYYISALRFSTKLPTVWASSPVSVKEKIQKAIFPEGVLYNHKNQAFRTTKVNEVFYHIASLTSDTGGNEKGQTNTKVDLSYQVGETGQLLNQFIKDLVALQTLLALIGQQ